MEQFEELSLKRLAEIIFKHIGMIVAVTLIAGILSFVYSETMIVPEYESSVSFYVNNGSGEESNKTLGTDIAASKMLVDTYSVIIRSDRVLGEVSSTLYEKGLGAYGIGTLRDMITSEAVDETEVFKISICHTDKELTKEIGVIIEDIVPRIIESIVKPSKVSVIDVAKEGVKVSPNIQTNMILGLIIGLFLSCAFVILREIFDMRVKNEDELEQWFKLPILGVIPDISTSQQTKKPGYYSYRRNATTYEYKREVRQNGGK